MINTLTLPKLKIVLFLIIVTIISRLLINQYFKTNKKYVLPKIKFNKIESGLFLKNQTELPSKQSTIRILLWNKFYGHYYSPNDKKFCKENDCLVTNDRQNLSSFQAIVFHWFSIDPNDIPPKKYPGQKWIVETVEAPGHITKISKVKPIEANIDWVMSHRSDSQVFIPYGRFERCDQKWKIEEKFESKTKSIAWFVSNCRTNSNREAYVKLLSKYIDVDIYGGCGKLKCSRSKKDCNQMLSKKYKFYLSFENSICRDYITEKTFAYMEQSYIIPIVLGGANYSSSLPPNSYIDVFNFTSPKHLAQYLKIVGNDENLYNSYFKWKTNYCIIRESGLKNVCKLCQRLRNNWHLNGFSTIQEFRKWWKNESKCKRLEFENENIKLVNYADSMF